MAKRIIFSILLLWPVFTWAQHNRQQEIEAFKVSFMTQKMGLSAEQAKAFWPIYNEMHKEQHSLRMQLGRKMISYRRTADIDEMNDSQVQDLIENEWEFKQKSLELDKRYFQKFKQVVPVRIIGKFYRAEEAFKRELLNKYKSDLMKKP